MRIFHCWKQCCRSFSDSFFIISVAFAFTASTDWKRVPFNADLIFRNKKNYLGLGQVSRVDVPTRGSCDLPEMAQVVRCVPACFHGEESMSRSSTFQVFFFSPIHEGLSKPPYTS
jgi:hypothetical protein